MDPVSHKREQEYHLGIVLRPIVSIEHHGFLGWNAHDKVAGNSSQIQDFE